MIERVGRKKSLGNPMLYATSDEFLRHFGLSSLKDLPPLKDADVRHQSDISSEAL
jgi:segregation and condensation protein B